MIRPATTAWLVLAMIIVLGLFQLKQEVLALEGELTVLNAEILTRREALHVLKAEWSYLNRPDRLARLSARFLDLGPVSSDQFAAIASLPLRSAAAREGGGMPPVPLPAPKPDRRPLLAARIVR